MRPRSVIGVAWHGCSVIGRGEAGGCAVQPEPVLEVRGILPRPDDLPCCVAALRGGVTVGETEGLAELVGGELGAPGRSTISSKAPASSKASGCGNWARTGSNTAQRPARR